MKTVVSYDIPGIVKLLSHIATLKAEGYLVIQHLLDEVEQQLEEDNPGASIKQFCSRPTFDKYLRLVRLHAPDGIAYTPLPFRGVMRMIKPPAFHLLVSYCNKVKPNSIEVLGSVDDVEAKQVGA